MGKRLNWRPRIQRDCKDHPNPQTEHQRCWRVPLWSKAAGIILVAVLAYQMAAGLALSRAITAEVRDIHLFYNNQLASVAPQVADYSGIESTGFSREARQGNGEMVDLLQHVWGPMAERDPNAFDFALLARHEGIWTYFMASNSSFVDKHAYFKSLPAALAPREVAQNLSPREDVEWMRGDPIVMQTQVSQHFSDWFKKAAEAQGWDFSDARLTSIYWSDRSNDPVPAAISRTVRAVAWGVMFFFIPLAVLVAWRITRRARYLSDAVDQLAAGNYNVRVPATGRDEIGRLGRQFNHMVEALEDREKLRSAIRVAAQLQAKLLPEAPQDLPNLDIAAANRMCERIGGDYYDFVRKNGDLWIVAGDISGHGLEAGLLMSAARANVRLLVTLGNDPLTVLKKLNRRLVKDFAGGYFLTLALMKVNLQTLEYEHVSAGHEPTLLLSNGDIHRFQTTCPPLGLFKELPCKRTAETGRFHKGDRLLMSTDGLRECFNANEEELGHGPIHETLRREGENANELTRDFMDLVERHRDGYEFQDDLTLVMVNITGEGQDAQANLIEEEAHALVSAPV